ncbi:hypothetical protein SAMN03159444_01039 [Pseudomonas sp. NFACC02]|nr:hypothetical protein SAMN03159444_01039 [Pseudomonas sp. NFACC02]
MSSFTKSGSIHDWFIGCAPAFVGMPPRASSLPQFAVWTQVRDQPGPLWETSEVTRVWAAIRTNAVGQSPLMVLTQCFRQQAGSHRSAVWTLVCEQPSPCRSRPRLRGQRMRWIRHHRYLLTHRIRRNAAQSKLTPTGLRSGHRFAHQPGPLWETSEVTRAANAMDQAPSMFADPPHSPASRLPQTLCCV